MGKRKHNHIASQTNASRLMEMDGGSAFQSTLEISTTRPQVLALPLAASAAAPGRNIWRGRERERVSERDRRVEVRMDETRSGGEVKGVKRTAVFIFGSPVEEGVHMSEPVSVGESSRPLRPCSPFLFIFICFSSLLTFLVGPRVFR